MCNYGNSLNTKSTIFMSFTLMKNVHFHNWTAIIYALCLIILSWCFRMSFNAIDQNPDGNIMYKDWIVTLGLN